LAAGVSCCLTDNEAESAKFAATALGNLGLDTRVIDRICKLIQWTADHAAPDDDGDALLFLGADLGILSSSADRYDAYRQAIRREYDWVPEREFLAGRKRVLEGFLNRSKIYRSKPLTHFEGPARHNISAEIAQIDGALRTLAS
jgi:predicted metal-dependent HD superfamily phosphohydrolase